MVSMNHKNFVKKLKKKLKIKIIAQKEPYFCKKLFKIVNNCNCKKSCKIKISGTLIRKLLNKKKKYLPTSCLKLSQIN